MTTSRTQRHRADPKKAGGIVYTPPGLAAFLADQALKALGPVSSVRILDPVCGDGELLLAAAEAALRRGIRIEKLTGYDTDGTAIRTARRRLAGHAGVELRCADFLQTVADMNGPPNLLAGWDNGRLEFDLVISNPPYVRTQTLGSTTARALERRFGLSGRVDLYQAFAVAMIEALRPCGAVGLLCSNKFLTNRTGRSMRGLLHQELVLQELVDLGDTKLFDAAVLPVIVSGTRRPASDGTEHVRFRSVYERTPAPGTRTESTHSILGALSSDVSGFVTDGDRTFLVREGMLGDVDDASLPWNPIDRTTRRSLKRIRQRGCMTLRDIGKVRVGVKTTADKVFIRTDWDRLPESHRPEKELLRPLLTHRDVRAWHCRPGDRTILYPYRDRSGRTVPISLDDYPRAAAHLESHRERLSS